MPIRVCSSAVFLVLALAGVGCWPRSAFGQDKSTGGSNPQGYHAKPPAANVAVTQ